MDGLRQTLVNLLDNENATLATTKMKELGADPMLLPALMKLAARYNLLHSVNFQIWQLQTFFSDEKQEIRQTAAVVLRRESAKHYGSIASSDQLKLKEAVLAALGSENHGPTWSALAEVASTLLLLSECSWPEFFTFIKTGKSSKFDLNFSWNRH